MNTDICFSLFAIFPLLPKYNWEMFCPITTPESSKYPIKRGYPWTVIYVTFHLWPWPGQAERLFKWESQKSEQWFTVAPKIYSDVGRMQYVCQIWNLCYLKYRLYVFTGLPVRGRLGNPPLSDEWWSNLYLHFSLFINQRTGGRSSWCNQIWLARDGWPYHSTNVSLFFFICFTEQQQSITQLLSWGPYVWRADISLNHIYLLSTV